MSKVPEKIATQPYVNAVEESAARGSKAEAQVQADTDSLGVHSHRDIPPGKHTLADLAKHAAKQTPKRVSMEETAKDNWQPGRGESGPDAKIMDPIVRDRGDGSKKFDKEEAGPSAHKSEKP